MVTIPGPGQPWRINSWIYFLGVIHFHEPTPGAHETKKTPKIHHHMFCTIILPYPASARVGRESWSAIFHHGVNLAWWFNSRIRADFILHGSWCCFCGHAQKCGHSRPYSWICRSHCSYTPICSTIIDWSEETSLYSWAHVLPTTTLSWTHIHMGGIFREWPHVHCLPLFSSLSDTQIWRHPCFHAHMCWSPPIGLIICVFWKLVGLVVLCSRFGIRDLCVLVATMTKDSLVHANWGWCLGFRGLACGFCTMTMFSWHVPSVLCVDVQESMVSFRAQDS